MGDGFTEIEQNAWGGFLGVYGRMNRMIEEDLQSHSHITHVEFEILLRLSWNENHRVRIQDLAAESVLTRSGVSRVVERLEKAGLVTREEASEDRRGAYAVLTAEGAARFQKAVKAHVAFVRENFLSHYSEKELEQMAAFWQRLENQE
ncbi:MAG: MarR family transcriptional regulator [Anaerolineales bacterium]|nr:MarR family transcriptional regulator [Anaerolineales bacterium]